MSFTFCSSGAIVFKAGANVNAAIAASGAYLAQVCDEAESFINTATRVNYSDTFSGLNDDVKKILQQTASDLGGMYLIMYDMGGYTSRFEAQTMLDVLRDRIERNLDLLKDKRYTDFIDGA